jgi:mediator of RNA polymerase II transcription subunit 6
MSGIHSNSVLFYFAQSPFFDPTSNNAVLTLQAMYNMNMYHIIQTREAFEGRLKTMSGLEFIVAQEPAEMAPGTGTGVWVIRKQTRRKRQPEDDEITVHASYFVVGENIYMAPAVSDVLGSRMLSILTSLNKFMSTASSLPDFSPSLGHTYLPPPNASHLKGPESQLSQASKENTLLPDSLPTSKKALPASTSNTAYLNSRLLDETLNILLKYGDEYMDENPITGYPGEFHLSTTGRKEREKLIMSLPGDRVMQIANKTTVPPTTGPKTDTPAARKGSKGDKSPKAPGIPKPKRRKSKALVSSGISPT